MNNHSEFRNKRSGVRNSIRALLIFVWKSIWKFSATVIQQKIWFKSECVVVVIISNKHVKACENAEKKVKVTQKLQIGSKQADNGCKPARTLQESYRKTFKFVLFVRVRWNGCCCWFTPPLPWDGGMAQTAIQVHAINLIELGQGKSGSPFRTSHGCKLPTGSPTTNKAECHWWVPKSRLLRHAG